MDSISELPVKLTLLLTDEVAVSNKGRGSLPEKTTLQAISNLVGGGGGGSAQIYTGAFADPNDNGEDSGLAVTPADTNAAAVYYQDQAVPPVVWLWSIANQNWFVILS